MSELGLHSVKEFLLAPLPRAVAVLCVAAGLAGAAAAQMTSPSLPSDETHLEAWRVNITVYHLLEWDLALIADPARQDLLRAQDQKTFQAVFDEALAEVDLKQDLEKVSRFTAGDLRYRLVTRPGCLLCEQPEQMRKWIDRYSIVTDRQRLADAVWDWDTLRKERIPCIQKQGWTPEKWRTTLLMQRRTILRDCVPDELALVNGPFPRDRATYDKMMAAAKASIDVFFPNEFFDIIAKLDKAEALLKAQERAQVAARTGDPAAANALKLAHAAADPGAAAAALTAYYDHAAGHEGDAPGPGPGLAAEPPGPSAASYRTLATMMEGSLMSAVQGSWSGDELNAFYKDHPLHVEIHPLDHAWAMYDPRKDMIVLSRTAIDQLLQEQGTTVDKALSNPEAVRRLGVAFSSTFVHETTHQRTHAWETANGLHAFPAVDDEQSAMENEAVFLIEKFRRDKTFAADFRRAAEPSSLAGRIAASTGLTKPGPVNIAADSLGMAKMFRDDPEHFTRVVRSSMYAYRSGNEGVADDEYARYRGLAESYEAELRQRAGMSPAARAAREAAPAETIPDGVWPWEPYDGISTPALADWAAKARKKTDEVQAQYALYRRHADEADTTAYQRRQTLTQLFLPSRTRTAVPPPGATP